MPESIAKYSGIEVKTPPVSGFAESESCDIGTK
jgi:hypothetical protein